MTVGPALRAESGIESFDQAIWTDWVPKIIGCVADPTGMSTLYQAGPPGIDRRNEAHVGGGKNACLLIWDRGCSRMIETRFAGQPLAFEPLAGQGVFIPPGVDSKWVSDSGAFSGVMHLHFTPSLLTQIADDLCTGFSVAALPLIANFDNAPLVTTVRWLFRETRTSKPSTLMWDTASAFLALQLVRSLDQNLVSRPPFRGGLATWQLRRVTEYLAARFAEDIKLEELARLTGLSVFHFARAFKRTTGVSPHAYLVELRVEYARRLLETTDRTVTEIAFEVGYESSQSLARVFVNKTGLSPSAYRRDRRQ